MNQELSVNGNPKPLLQKVRFTHDAVIDQIIMQPEITQRELARTWGYTEAWISIIINSDSFKNRLAERKADLVDPIIVASLNERLDGLASRALDKLLDRIEGRDPLAPGPVKTQDLIAAAKLGVGDRNNRPAVPSNQQNLYVVNLPPPAQNSQTWLDGSSVKQKPELVYDLSGVNRE